MYILGFAASGDWAREMLRKTMGCSRKRSDVSYCFLMALSTSRLAVGSIVSAPWCSSRYGTITLLLPLSPASSQIQ